jgi:hypothetical protein
MLPESDREFGGFVEHGTRAREQHAACDAYILVRILQSELDATRYANTVALTVRA